MSETKARSWAMGDRRLDPREAVAVAYRDLRTMAGHPPLEANDKLYEDRVRVPRIPLDAAEADAMLQMTTIFMDATAADPSASLCTYCGYSDDELRRGKPAVIVGKERGR